MQNIFYLSFLFINFWFLGSYVLQIFIAHVGDISQDEGRIDTVE